MPIRNSMKSLGLVHRGKPLVKHKQNIRVITGILIKKDGRRKCIECGGFPRLGEPHGLQVKEKGKTYRHLPDCKLKGIF